MYIKLKPRIFSWLCAKCRKPFFSIAREDFDNILRTKQSVFKESVGGYVNEYRNFHKAYQCQKE